MRLCHVIETSSGGSAQVMADLIRGQIRQGDEVTLVYSPLRADSFFLAAIKEIPSLRVRTLPVRRAVGPRDMVSLWKLYKLLKEEGPFDIIHSHSSKAGALARLAGICLPGARQVYTPHAFITMTPGGSRLFGLIEKFLSRFCDAVVTVSPQEEKHALEYLGLDRKKVRMIPNGIRLAYPADRDAARALMGYVPHDFVIGFVGRLAAQKNPLRLVETFRILAAQRADMQLAIVGDGPLRHEVMMALARYRLTGRARFYAGFNARDLMPAFDALLGTSDYESYALIFPEALDAGVPIVTTPVGIADEAVVEGKTGYVADFLPENLAIAVMKLAGRSLDERRQIPAEAREHARRFGVERTIAETQALYRELLAS